MEITIIFALPVVKISKEQREEIKDILSRATDQMLNNPRGLDSVIGIGRILLKNDINMMDINIIDIILNNILNNKEAPAPSELKKLWKEWELIRDSILADNIPEHHCSDCNNCDKCGSDSR